MPCQTSVPLLVSHAKLGAGLCGAQFKSCVVLVAGDSSTTACAIARECGILSAEDHPVLGLPNDLMHLSATKSTMDSTWSSTDESSIPTSTSHDRTMSGSQASTSSSSTTASQDGASRALSTPARDVHGNGHSNSNGAASHSTPSSHISSGMLLGLTECVCLLS